ncbi:PREDICTED: uncharacterized protein LOC109183134 [Ipomoea nil]|uniref:uncharacterized protein LOC109183134 n=1 Tax=Ipomoea nil TaxID=35883 RepID=UPI000901D8A3|nr:PREDICTED: uncharacterized protein LOC109183134 [Ipomoea nil]
MSTLFASPRKFLRKYLDQPKKFVQRTQKSAKPEEEMKKSEATVQSVSSSSQRVTKILGSKRILPAKPSINIEASPMELDTKESDANPKSKFFFGYCIERSFVASTVL